MRRPRPGRKLAAALAALALSCAFAAPAWADEPAPLEDVAFYELMLDQESLSSELTAMQRGATLLLPLGELCRLLGLAVRVDARAGTAEGFLLREDQPFALDMLAGHVTIGTRRTRFSSGRVARAPDDLYVERSLLEQWLPVDLAIDAYGARVVVHPRDMLPMQRRLERERRLAALAGRLPDPEVPSVDTPYATAE